MERDRTPMRPSPRLFASGVRGHVRRVESPQNQVLKIFRRALAGGISGQEDRFTRAAMHRSSAVATPSTVIGIEGPLLLKEAMAASVSEDGVPRPGLPPPNDRRSPVILSVLVAQSAAVRFAEMLARLNSDTEIVEVPDRLFAGVAQTETPQGIAALVELPMPALYEVLARSDPLLLVACGVQDPGNLGTMMRSAQAFGAMALLALKQSVDPFNPKAIRSSGGAIFKLPVFRGLESGDLFRDLREAGVGLVAAETRAGVPAPQADLRGAVAVMIGGEASGLNAALIEQSTLRVNIPIRPDADSVNAGVAAGILLYEAARQRGFLYGRNCNPVTEGTLE
jgi:TrmH family RNA methyltransferase